MKRTIVTMMIGAMAPLAMAGSPSVHEAEVPVAPAPAPAPACESSLAIEIAGAAAIAEHHMLKSDWGCGPRVNNWGGDITAVYNVTKEQAFTLRFGLMDGSGSTTYEGSKETFKVSNVSIMPGYRFTTPVSDSTSLFVGANIGWTYQNVRYVWTWEDERETDRHGNDAFAYSAEIGLRFDLTESMNVFVAYQFSGSDAKVKYGEERTRAQIYHGVRMGVGFTF